MVPGEIHKSIGLVTRSLGGLLDYLPTLAYTAIFDSVPCAKCVIRGANINTHDSTEYFHIYDEEWESIDAGHAPTEESAAEEQASSEGGCPKLEEQEAVEMHVEAPPRVGYSDTIGLYPFFSPETVFHHINIRQFCFVHFLFISMRLLFCCAAF
ncbi:hypothetical protein BGX38DRAFT_1231578, partial [Terfezia claveryi]